MEKIQKLPKAVARKKDSSIELLRIYACVMVIWSHIQISYMVGDEINRMSLLIKCLIGDNVPVFFLILGFYMFTGVQSEDRLQKIPGVFLHKLKGFFLRVYIPTLIVTLIACFAGDFFYHQKTFTQLFTQFHMNWEYLKQYVILQSPTDMVGQFWYIVVYIKLLVFFPLTALLCADDKQYNILRRVYMALSFGNIVLEDLGFLRQASMLTISEYVFDRHFLYILLGYELWLFFKKNSWPRKFQIMFGVLVFACGVGLRYGLTMYSFHLFGVASNAHYMGLECAPSYVSSAGCLLTFYSVFKGFHNRVIQFLGSLTLYIFMVHGMMLRYFSHVGERILAMTDNGASALQSIQYYLMYGAVIFFTSFLFGLALKLIYDGASQGICILLRKFSPNIFKRRNV